MAKVYNLARMYTSTSGPGTLTLTSAVPPFLTFAQAGVQDNDQVIYAINDFTGLNVEEGLGTYSGGTLTRDTVYRSSGAGNTGKINVTPLSEVCISLAKEFFEPLDVAHGGTGNTTLTSHAVLLGAAIGAIGFATVGTSGRLLIDQGASADPAFTAMSGDATIAGSGALTLASVISAGGPTGSATVAPVITYDAKGRLTAVSSATITPAIGNITGLGTGVATALGVNVGTDGAFVVKGGALGSPSSVGTMPAFTLGGTVSGGGNQINNVIIGTVTPLAGFFKSISLTPADSIPALTALQSPTLQNLSANGTLNLVNSQNLFQIGTGTKDSAAFTSYTLVTNGATAAGNAVLHFASVPGTIVAGLCAMDTTTAGVIPYSTTVLSTTATTVTLSANATGGGVLNGDTIQFVQAGAWINGFTIEHVYGGSTVTNGRQTLYVYSVLNGATSQANGNNQYVGFISNTQALTSDGGTDLTTGAKGGIFSINTIAALNAGATNFNEVGIEFDTTCRAGSSVKYKNGISVVALNDDAVRGSSYDIAISVSSQDSASIGWLIGLGFGNANNGHPMAATGTLIATYGSDTVANGLDFSSYTITSNFLKGPGGFSVTGAGATTTSALLVQGANTTEINSNSQLSITARNLNAGAAAYVSKDFITNAGQLSILVGSTAFAAATLLPALIYTTTPGEFRLSSQGTGGFLTLYNAGPTERARITPAGGLAVGLTTDTTAGIVNVLTGFRINSAAASGNLLQGNGTNFVSVAMSGDATIASGGALTITPVSKFQANKNGTDQTGIADATFTQLTFGTEDYDTGNHFASNAWTPPAGPIIMSAAMGGSGTITAGKAIAIAIYKNGSIFKQGSQPAQTNVFSSIVVVEDVANGTDVYTVFAFIDVDSGTATVLGGTAFTWFAGHSYK